MLLEIAGDKIILDENPYIQNLRFNLDARKHLFRLKLKYITSTNLEPIDLAMKYNIPNVSVTSASISIRFSGTEMIRNISFQGEISFSIFHKSFHVKGSFGAKVIDQKVNKLSDILDIIKSELTTMNDK